MGSQRIDRGEPCFDERAKQDEAPVRRVRLDAYLVSKYEMNQSQWKRLQGVNPSRYTWGFGGGVGPTNPVEQVSWDDCHQVLTRMGLSLPTEAQWEYACRGGDDKYTSWFGGNEIKALRGAANVSDVSYQRAGGTTVPVPWDDRFVVHSPVGSFRPNGFGMHDMHGNVWEWCRDRFPSYWVDPVAGDGLRASTDTTNRSYRGGSFRGTSDVARSSLRYGHGPSHRDANFGVRPIRKLNSR